MWHRVIFTGLLVVILGACASSTEPEAASVDADGRNSDAAPLAQVQPCPEVRSQICTMDYRPVCGTAEDGSRREYGNFCGACGNEQVVSAIAGACPE